MVNLSFVELAHSVVKDKQKNPWSECTEIQVCSGTSLDRCLKNRFPLTLYNIIMNLPTVNNILPPIQTSKYKITKHDFNP